MERASTVDATMSDHARFWFWIVVLALACVFLGAVLASAAQL
jgi:hypothetical protein